MEPLARPFKVCNRVYQVGGQDMTSGNDCCVYLVDGRADTSLPGKAGHDMGPLALIDTGYGPSYKSIVANILRLGFEPEGLESALLTHCHIDHVGGAGLFREDYHVILIAHEADAVPLESGDRMMTAAFLYNVKFSPLQIDRKLSLEEEAFDIGNVRINVIHTPGHSPGSVAAYMDIEGFRVLFGQDIHGPFHPDLGSDLDLWRDSMQRLLELDADILCEGHFGIYSPSSAVRAYIQSFLERFAH